MTFIMLCSCVCVMNVSSVWAADVISWSVTDYGQWKDSSGNALTSATISEASVLTSSVVLNGTTYTLTYNAGKSDEFNYTSATDNKDLCLKMNGAGKTTWTNSLSARAFRLSVPAKATVTVSAAAYGTNVAKLSYSWGATGTVSTTGNDTVTTAATAYSVTNNDTISQDIYFTFTAKQYITGITLTLPSGNENTFSLNGTCTGLSDNDKFKVDSFDVVVDTNGNWSISATAETSPFSEGTYTITPPIGYTVNPTEVTVTASDDGLTYTATPNIEFTKTFATVSGTVPTELAGAGDYVEFIGTSNYTATIADDNSYSIELPAGTYTVALQSDTYKAVQKYISNNSITVAASEIATHNLTASDEITVWDFKNDADKYKSTVSNYYQTYQKIATMKGLYIDATSGKFNPRPDNSDAQVNSGTIIYVPVKTSLDTVTIEIRSGVSFSDSEFTTLNDVNYRKFIAEANGYIYSITRTIADVVNVSGTITTDDGVTAPTEIKFTDESTGAIYKATVTDGTYSVDLAASTTYKITSDNLNASADPAAITTGTENITGQVINFTKAALVELSGTITSDTGATGFVTALQFVDMTDDTAVYTATVTDNNYTAQVAPGCNYNTVATTNNGMTTSNRVAVGTSGKTDEEVYFVSANTTVTYDYTQITALSTDGKVAIESGKTHVVGNNGNVITVPVNGSALVTVEGYYKYSFNFNGGKTKENNTGSTSTKTTETYTTSADDTSVTINILGTSYFTKITVEPVTDTTYKSSISVPGDYSTVTAAIAAIKAMARPEGEAGRVTINLTANITEQIHVDASYVTINGNGNTIDWYYALPCIYYSIDSNTGLYNEELARDKYSKSPVKTSYWGGVIIVDASNFYAENVTFKNTFNYEVTEEEIADGAEFEGAAKSTNNQTTNEDGTLRSSISDPKAYSQKERASALILTSNSDCAEFYNVSILSGQDTLGYNGAHTAKAYFKNCTIGGNTDFICGAGNMLFDNCTLELYSHSDSVSKSYITAAQATKYLFRNCKVTLNNNGAAMTAYYGRAWKQAADVKFVNTVTNDLVENPAWSDWTANGTTAADASFGEYYNRTSGSGDDLFEDTTTGKVMTDAEYIALSDSDYLGDWTPKNYIAGVVDVKGVVFDNSGNAVVYGEIPASAVDSNEIAGFTLSTETKLFGQYSLTSDKVYEKVTYIDESGKDAFITPETDGNYLVAVLVEGVKDATDVANLYIRGINGTTSDIRYNDIVTAQLSTATETAE